VGTVVLDTSVVIGLRDPHDAHHEAATRAVREHRRAADRLVLPATALAEVLVGASRLGSTAMERVERFVDSIIDDIHPIERRVARAAAAYHARHRALRLPDAIVLGVGEVLDAEVLLSADQAWQGLDRRVRVLT
jgi:predicted nucleic acid-binding protein